MAQAVPNKKPVDKSLRTPVRRALLSVFDKTGLADLAHGLHRHGVALLASGGTAKLLDDEKIPYIAVDAHTGAPEILGGRVKTLHPRIHAGILADRTEPSHMSQLVEHHHDPIDLVVCNLYPFEQTLSEGGSREELIEKIDIGGPTLVRAAAKNCDGGVGVLVDPNDYPTLLQALDECQGLPWKLRWQLASKAFAVIAEYDLAIAEWSSEAFDEEGDAEEPPTEFPDSIEGFARASVLRYGENPHQKAALYVDTTGIGLGCAHQLQGKDLSYNNYLDLDAALRSSAMFEEGHACAIVKHTNPCGLAVADDQVTAFKLAFEGDPVSAFGSVIGFNQPMEGATAQALKEAKLFVECIIAPGFEDGALEALESRENLRLIEVHAGSPFPPFHAHRIAGGLLVQEVDMGPADPSTWRCVTDTQLQAGWLEELHFAMQAVATLKSNAIAITKGQALLGAGAGQMSRVDAAEQAIKKAGTKAQGAFLASDAFFPFDDCVKLAAAAGIVAIVQPGGSKRDQDSIDACNKAGIAMVFTEQRHFRH